GLAHGGTMTIATHFARLSPTTIADALTRSRVMDIGIRPLWPGMPRVAGPAYPVRCPPGDNLMLHAAIYRAAPGAVIVCEAGDVKDSGETLEAWEAAHRSRIEAILKQKGATG